MKKYFVFTITALMAVSATAFAQKETTSQTTTQPEHPEPVFKYVEQMPEPGYDLMAYMKDNIKYPAEHEKTGGMRVMVDFIVNADGNISDVKVLSPHRVPKPYQEEAIRLVRSMPVWKPGRQNGLAVKVYYHLPVIFSKAGK
jgi:protein TonB